MDTKLEVVIVPVSDVDRAKQFYKALGWREDIDLVTGKDLRVPTGLHRASGDDTSGDMIVSRAGRVSDFYAAGMVSAAVNDHYGAMQGVQIQYAPRGKATGLCAALARTAYQNEGLSLQPCTTPGTTVFIIDTVDSPGTAPTYFPILNASTNDFVHPFAMTIEGNPAHHRFVRIRVRHLVGNPGHVPENQLWGSNVLN